MAEMASLLFLQFRDFLWISVIENDWGIVICATVLLIAVKVLSRLAKGALRHWMPSLLRYIVSCF